MGARGYSAAAVGETIAKARALAEQLDRPDCLVPLLYSERVFHVIRGEHRLGLSLAEQMEKLGRARNDEATLLLGHYLHAISRYYLGEFAAARALFEQCHGLSDPAHRTVYYATLTLEDPHIIRRANLAAVLVRLGYIDQARALMKETLLEARRLSHDFTVSWVFELVVSGGRVCRLC
jgi:hypothetical protein